MPPAAPGPGVADRAAERLAMVTEQCASRDIRDPRVLAALAAVPRHRFVPDAWQAYAYTDRALPLAEGQTVSQPYIVACIVEALALAPKARVLDVGTGSGYQAAVLAHLAAEVFTIERRPALAAAAAARLQALGIRNVRTVVGDGRLGLPAHAPFDGIAVAAAAVEVPPALLAQLAVGGRLVIPVGPESCQDLVCITNRGNGYRQRVLCPSTFVPLLPGTEPEPSAG